MATKLGTEGNDFLAGDKSQGNALYGMGGDDFVIGGDKDDLLHGHDGDDFLVGSGGGDVIVGGSGDDRIVGDDSITGNTGDKDGRDTIYGGWGDDAIVGGGGDDIIVGGLGDDVIYGGTGNDRMWGGGEGDRPDLTFGETDFDTFVFRPGHGNDRIGDFNPNEDRIDLSHFNSVTGLADLSIEQKGGHAVISVASHSGDSITLTGVNADDLDAGDFIFQGAADADAG